MSEQFTELGRIVTKLNEMSFTDDRAEALLDMMKDQLALLAQMMTYSIEQMMD